jgi:hypothetical protein
MHVGELPALFISAEGEEEEDDGNRAADSKDDVGAGLFD